MNQLYSRLHAIRRSRDGTGGSGGRQKAALARLHSARSLNRSQGFTAGCRGSSLAPLGRRSSPVTRLASLSRHWNPRVVNGREIQYRRRGQNFSVRLATVDHIRPLHNGGQSTMTNMVVACAQCNQLRNQIDQLRRVEWYDLAQRRAFAQHCLTIQNRMRQKLRWPEFTEAAIDLWEECEEFISCLR